MRKCRPCLFEDEEQTVTFKQGAEIENFWGPLHDLSSLCFDFLDVPHVFLYVFDGDEEISSQVLTLALCVCVCVCVLGVTFFFTFYRSMID